MKKYLAAVVLSMVASSASAATVIVDCDSPGSNVNPPASGTLADSVCNTLAPLPGGSIVNSILLNSRYAISLQLGGLAGGADFGHTTNVGNTAWDNGTGANQPTTAANPFQDLTWGPVACPSAACTSALTALLAGTAKVTTTWSNPTGQASSVSADYSWQIDYTPEQTVPEPTTLALFGASLLGLAVRRRQNQ